MKKTFSILLVIMAMAGCRGRSLENANACLALGDYERAQKLFNAALERNPADFSARLGMGKALLQQAADNGDDSADLKAALMNLEAARSIVPDAPVSALLGEVWSMRADALFAKGDTLGALDALTRAIDLDTAKVDHLNKAAIVFFHRGESGKAVQLLRHALTLDSLNVPTRFNLGMVYWAQDSVAAAHAQWYFALQHSPDDPDILYWFSRAEKAVREDAHPLSRR